MASKPDKYEQKYWLAVNVDSGNAFLYSSKDEFGGTNKHDADQVMMKFLQPYYSQERNGITDNYFTDFMQLNWRDCWRVSD